MKDNFHSTARHMPESTSNTKGQTTTPPSVCRAIGAVAGTRLVWHVQSGGRLSVRAKTKWVQDLTGMLTPADGTRLSVEQLSLKP